MRLNQVSAPTRDLDRSIAFYALLGLRLIVKSEAYARFELPEGEATFSLHVVEGEIAREPAPWVYFECADLDSEIARLKSAGIAFEREAQMQTWLWREAWLRDPAGNAICLYHAGANRTHPPWRLPQGGGGSMPQPASPCQAGRRRASRAHGTIDRRLSPVPGKALA